MSITRLVITNVVLDEEESSEEVAVRMREHLQFYANKHPEFSFKLEEDREHNKIKVKTVTLDGNVN